MPHFSLARFAEPRYEPPLLRHRHARDDTVLADHNNSFVNAQGKQATACGSDAISVDSGVRVFRPARN